MSLLENLKHFALWFKTIPNLPIIFLRNCNVLKISKLLFDHLYQKYYILRFKSIRIKLF